MRKVVLYFGSFNPIHNGHTAIAQYVVEQELCDELWFVVSPQNPLKPSALLAPDKDRLQMVEIAVEELFEGQLVRVSSVEFTMPKPSYTIDTLRVLEKEHPDCKFAILGGADMFRDIDAWKESERLLSDYQFLIYPRDDIEVDGSKGDILFLSDAPRFPFSSTAVRQRLERDEGIEQMVCSGVAEYIKKHKLWQTK